MLKTRIHYYTFMLFAIHKDMLVYYFEKTIRHKPLIKHVAANCKNNTKATDSLYS